MKCVLCGKETGSARDNHGDTYICIAELMERIVVLEEALTPFLVESEFLDGIEDAWKVPMTYTAGVLRAAAKAMEGR